MDTLDEEIIRLRSNLSILKSLDNSTEKRLEEAIGVIKKIRDFCEKSKIKGIDGIQYKCEDFLRRNK